MQRGDVPVEDTNAQALQAKLSAIKTGYFKDEFATDFVKPGPKRDIIMHRGYWARTNIFKVMIERFLSISPETEKQIISLGCGYDTLFFNLNLEEKYQQKNNKYTFYEIDLPVVVQRKVKLINESFKCQEHFPSFINQDPSGNTLITENFKLFPCDLTDLPDFKAKLQSYGIDFSKPTFVFAECVLTYIKTQYTNELLQYFHSNFDMVQIMDYEMVNPNTPFGKQMVKNFELRGCPLQGIHDYPTIQAHKERLEKMQFQKIEIYDMLTIYNVCTDQEERKRIEKLELLDEYEEWGIFLQHYFISLESNSKSNSETNQKFLTGCKLNMNIQ